MKIELRTLSPPVTALMLALALLVLGGAWAAWQLETQGHGLTGMDNHIVWGLPHVFAVFLVVSASGALNVASMASAFGQQAYKPLAPLSALLALALLAGGLAILLLDLGRPDRLTVALTHFNFRSVFAWNVILYSGFMALVLAYLVTMLDARWRGWTPRVGTAAFVWRLALTTGTGSIFGFLIGRQALGSALLGPLFVLYSLAYGMALYLLVLQGLGRVLGETLQPAILQRLTRVLGWCIAAALYGVLVLHLTQAYFARQHGLQRFLLVDGGLYPWLFWLGQIGLGGLLPLWLLRQPTGGRSALAALLVLVGAFAQLSVTIIGSQAFPVEIFPGLQVRSSFADGVVVPYHPQPLEWLLALGGLALSGLLVLIGLRLFTLLPTRLDRLVAEDSSRL